MIRKQDILDRAAEWQLRPEVVEKDYVLGWLLFGLASHPESSSKWAFKGGTCIKKCYVETYRFSEDLDFSLMPDALYTEMSIRAVLVEATKTAAEKSGIELPENLIEVRPTKDKLGRPAFQGRISYRGPLATPFFPRVLLDITQHEAVLDEPEGRIPFHPYPDVLPPATVIGTYTLNELLAEKTRALYERTRPRDLYDVIYLLENKRDAFDLSRAHALFVQKCASKNFDPPNRASLLDRIQDDGELRSEWENMLAHQLPVLPRLDDLLQRAPDLLAWIDKPEGLPVESRLAPPPAPVAPLVAPAGIHFWGSDSPLEAIRFAGANRLLLKFEYNNEERLVEPYSLRQASTGNILLYAWQQGKTHISAFNVEKMRSVRTTDVAFQPRYQIELLTQGSISIPHSVSPIRRPSFTTYQPQRSTAQRRTSPFGPKYIFQCAYCGKRFRRSRNETKLNKHKMKDGYSNCPGTRGYLVEIK